MPTAVEDALKKVASKYAKAGKLHTKGRGKDALDKAKNAFVYGTLRHKFNWKPSREK